MRGSPWPIHETASDSVPTRALATDAAARHPQANQSRLPTRKPT